MQCYLILYVCLPVHSFNLSYPTGEYWSPNKTNSIDINKLIVIFNFCDYTTGRNPTTNFQSSLLAACLFQDAQGKHDLIFLAVMHSCTFVRSGKRFNGKKIVLLTDFSGEFSDDQSTAITSGLLNEGIELVVM